MARSTIHAWMMENVWRREEKGGGKGKGSERGGRGEAEHQVDET